VDRFDEGAEVVECRIQLLLGQAAVVSLEALMPPCQLGGQKATKPLLIEFVDEWVKGIPKRALILSRALALRYFISGRIDGRQDLVIDQLRD